MENRISSGEFWGNEGDADGFCARNMLARNCLRIGLVGKLRVENEWWIVVSLCGEWWILVNGLVGEDQGTEIVGCAGRDAARCRSARLLPPPVDQSGRFGATCSKQPQVLSGRLRMGMDLSKSRQEAGSRRRSMTEVTRISSRRI